MNVILVKNKLGENILTLKGTKYIVNCRVDDNYIAILNLFFIWDIVQFYLIISYD